MFVLYFDYFSYEIIASLVSLTFTVPISIARSTLALSGMQGADFICLPRLEVFFGRLETIQALDETF